MCGTVDVQGRKLREKFRVLDSDYKLVFSEEVDDRGWDAFLESTPLGQFQQSSLWGKAKAKQGWKVARLILRSNCNEIEGGFQLLWRKKLWLRVGYVSKGPVFRNDSGRLLELGTPLITIAAKRYGIHALIVQVPDFAEQLASLLSVKPFEENRFVSVISANLMIDLTQGIAEIRKGMSRKTRQKCKQALERGVRIREGSEGDIKVFFRLMLATCARQGEKRANPETFEELLDIWRVFTDNNHIRLSLAICDGEIVAGLMCIMFGSRVTLWKKGWDGRFSERHPNVLLHAESLEWAVAQGYRSCDFLGLDRSIAEAWPGGGAPSEDLKKSRHFFNLSFGGKPELLPESRAYLKNPLYLSLYRGMVRVRSACRRFHMGQTPRSAAQPEIR